MAWIVAFYNRRQCFRLEVSLCDDPVLVFNVFERGEGMSEVSGSTDDLCKLIGTVRSFCECDKLRAEVEKLSIPYVYDVDGIFIKHIKAHLKDGENVICKI